MFIGQAGVVRCSLGRPVWYSVHRAGRCGTVFTGQAGVVQCSLCRKVLNRWQVYAKKHKDTSCVKTSPEDVYQSLTFPTGHPREPRVAELYFLV